MSIIEQYHYEGIDLIHSVDEKPNDRNFPIHMHDHYEMLCFVSGKVSYMVEGTLYELRPGTVLLMRSTETHKLIVNDSERYERYTISFYPEVLTSRGMPRELLLPFTGRMPGEKNVYITEDFATVDILALIRKTEEECRVLSAEPVLYPNLCSMLSAITCIFRSYPTREHYAGLPDTGRELLHYINAHITEELTLEGLSDYMHISQTQLNRLFKELTGTTVYQYILSKRLVLAQRQMMKGKSAVQAAKDCGFGDYSCFYRLYYKRFGCRPSDIRAENDEEVPQ